MFRKLGQYIPLQTDEEAKPMENGVFRTCQSDSSRMWMMFYRIYSITLHVLIISVIMLLNYSYKEHSGSKSRLLPSELREYSYPVLTWTLYWYKTAFAQNAVQYEEVTFDPSGFWKEPSEATPYEGPPSIKTEEMWSRLTDGSLTNLCWWVTSTWLTFQSRNVFAHQGGIRTIILRDNFSSWETRSISRNYRGFPPTSLSRESTWVGFTATADSLNRITSANTYTGLDPSMNPNLLKQCTWVSLKVPLQIKYEQTERKCFRSLCRLPSPSADVQ